MSEEMIKRIKDRIAYHADEKKFRFEIGKGVIDYLARDILADLKTLGGIFPPVTIGGKVYIIRRRKVKEGTVQYIGIGDCIYFNALFGDISKNFFMLQLTEKDIGRIVFLTPEDAERSLEE